MPVYAFTITLSAFLLFLLQPIVARQILPWFGGSAAVWTTCMMFFQGVLLAGYAYSDLLVRRFGPVAQRRAHGLLLLASLAFLPVALGDGWRPGDPERPVLAIVWLLSATVGLPYFMLSTTGPLLQAWFTRSHPDARVYRLYALSNAASLAALVLYPPLIEPAASVPAQALGWSAGYALFVLAGLLLLLRQAGRAGADPAIDPRAAPGAGPASEETASQAGDLAAAVPGPRETFAWFGYSMLGSVLLLAVTAHLTQNVASVPFLWLLPLTLYLLSFILCFDGRGWYRPSLFLSLTGLACVLMMAGFFGHLGAGGFERGAMPVVQGIVVYGAGLFVLCMFVHGELARRRPPAQRLTRFYLMLALGGAVGGVFVAVLAGMLFDAYLELPLALVLVAFMVLFSAGSERGRFLAMLGCLAVLVGAIGFVFATSAGVVASARNFYGTLSVRQVAADAQGPARLRLAHGNTVHGEQWLDPAFRGRPIGYYGAASGVGLALGWLHANTQGAHRVGVIGLGAGTLVSYGRAGDDYRFYEIDPTVAQFADRHFSFLRDSAAASAVVLGDGRLKLEAEAPNGYRMLVVDAFSSDAIPMHLLTVEAMRTYVQHVTPGGAVVFNISNRYLDLRPVIRTLADAVDWRVQVVHDRPESGSGLLPSMWAVVSADPDLHSALAAAGATEPAADPALRPWTDAYGNLFEVLSGRR